MNLFWLDILPSHNAGNHSFDSHCTKYKIGTSYRWLDVILISSALATEILQFCTKSSILSKLQANGEYNHKYIWVSYHGHDESIDISKLQANGEYNHKYIWVSYHGHDESTLPNAGNEIFSAQPGQYYTCWCPGSWRHQVISWYHIIRQILLVLKCDIDMIEEPWLTQLNIEHWYRRQMYYTGVHISSQTIIVGDN